MTHNFLPGAEAEYLEAVQFFEEQRAGLGAALIAEFERIVDLAVERPNSWRLVHSSGVRRIGLARFPYAVFLCGIHITGKFIARIFFFHSSKVLMYNKIKEKLQ